MKLDEDDQHGGLKSNWETLIYMLLHSDNEVRETGAIVAIGQGHYKHLLGAFQMHLDNLHQTQKPSNYKPLNAGSRGEIRKHEHKTESEFRLEKSLYGRAMIELLSAYRQLHPHNDFTNKTEQFKSYYLQ